MTTYKDAIAFMRRQHQSNSQSWRGLCQSSVRQAWGLPGGVASAKDSLANAKAKGRFHPKPANMSLEEWEKTVPIGAAVWTDRPGGSTYGHIILAGGRNKKIKRRIFWSVDITDSGGIDPTTLNAFPDRWGHVVLGWSDYLNGSILPVKKPAGKKKAKKGPGSKKDKGRK